jgi:hypothetical protein
VVVGRGPAVVLDEQVQVAYLVQDDGGVHDAWPIDLVKLLDG